MSRIGKAAILVPPAVTVNVKDNLVSVKGPKGELSRTVRPEITIEQKDGKLLLKRDSDERLVRGLHGLSRTLIANMIKGVTQGFERQLEVIGVGYRAQMEGKKLVMQIGYSHQVEVSAPTGCSIAVGKNNLITVSGIDKQAVGDLAAFIRSKRLPEVYKGKGIKYTDEVIRRKAGKAASKKK